MAGIEQTRGNWGSKIGFILAASGSAIGLGNIWRFPFVAGQNGGAIFVFFYIIFVIIIGLPILISEFTIGRNTQKNPVGAFERLSPGTRWKLVGGLGIVMSIGVLSFYALIAGLAVGYFLKILLGDFTGITTGAQSDQIFSLFTSNPLVTIGLLLVFLLVTALVVIRGVSGGIEKISKILMPTLFLLLIVLAIYSVTLEGAKKGLEFYFKPDFSKITVTTFAQALGQALFSLGAGACVMITYGSYVSRRDNLFKSAVTICFFDTIIAILAGLIIFPALFAMGMNPAQGPALIFVVLPSIFAKMPAGIIFGAGIFLLISLAALTSTISVLEVPVSYFVDERNWSRKKATLVIGSTVFIVGIPSALSMGAVRWLSNLPFLGMRFVEMMNILFGNYLLTIGAFFIAVFVGYKWGIKEAVKEIEQQGNIFNFKALWSFSIRFICPVAIAIILGYIIITKNYF